MYKHTKVTRQHIICGKLGLRADRTAYDVRYSCRTARTEPPKMSCLESSSSYPFPRAASSVLCLGRVAMLSPGHGWPAEGLLPGSKARCHTDVLGGASNPWLARELTYVKPWTGHASRPSVPHVHCPWLFQARKFWRLGFSLCCG